MDGTPELICQKILEGHEDWPNVEEGQGLRTDCQTAEIPGRPAWQEF